MRLAKPFFALALALPALVAGTSEAQACTITVTGVAFGNYDPRSTSARDGTGSISLDCRHNTPPTVALAAGSSGSYASRRMANGSSLLTYNLFADATRLSIWGNGTGGTVTVAPPITQSVGLRRIHQSTIYGRISAGQNVRAGTYSDTLYVTVTF